MSERQILTETLAPEPAHALAALLDLDPLPDDRLPPMWHWVYLLDRRPHRELGPDGHPLVGVPTPPGPGMRRMFAGGRVTTHGVLRLGVATTRTTRVLRSEEKSGRSGPLTFVTVGHEISQHGRVLVTDEQDIVYRAPGSALRPSPAPEQAAAARPMLTLDVDEAFLFRFSALTYNAHRIHYDRAYVREEGYDDLVVHGPLQALMMTELYRRHGVDLVGRVFGYRLVAPMTGPQRMVVAAEAAGLDSGVRTLSEHGVLTATANLTATG
ncbi:MAG TPA: MaoC family dehydratase N-terminal domain-containing protein [Nocardioides sp.]|uniref:FAS1-like dehydratase domain-containing protein n=1 Tax=Nocardioides sp. TaxID=35761 RepID=UPI002D7F177B|nr:MaoC family dehydratase N-terminal domain-containing protein [Nocardioides sp.]HET6654337.1 MaoC family dehydratase N-terminal domain-containing protein [Nocardioides sp.]